MRKSVVIMVMVGLMLWFPMLAEAKGKKGKTPKKPPHGLPQQISDLQQQINDIELIPGPEGPQGPAGADGADGLSGADGADGLPGADGVDGADGADGLPGADGAQGEQGEQGIPGECDCPIAQEQFDELIDRIIFLESDGLPRFSDMDDGTIRDNETGLIWLKDANCSELPGTDSYGKADWYTAISAAADLIDGTCGLTDGSEPGDWRLPTKEEWEVFMSDLYDNPALLICTMDGRRTVYRGAIELLLRVRRKMLATRGQLA